jgi:hypothetical protein
VGSLAADRGLRVQGGRLDTAARVEYTPEATVVDVERASLAGLQVDYVHRAASPRPTRAAVERAAGRAREQARASGLVFQAREIRVTGATVGFVNEAAQPGYRVFLDDIDARLENFAAPLSRGTATARVTARFMGAGPMLITATMRPETDGADLDLTASIEEVELRPLNDLLRAHGKIDVASGEFSVYAELHARNGRAGGYVKPLIHGLQVYESQQDRDKSLGQRIKEKAADLVSTLLRNRPREDVATVVPITGPLRNPRAKTWEAMVNLVQNAFFDAILPGFIGEKPRAASDAG